MIHLNELFFFSHLAAFTMTSAAGGLAVSAALRVIRPRPLTTLTECHGKSDGKSSGKFKVVRTIRYRPVHKDGNDRKEAA